MVAILKIVFVKFINEVLRKYNEFLGNRGTSNISLMKMSEEYENTQTAQHATELNSEYKPDLTLNLPNSYITTNSPVQQLPEIQLSAGRQKLRKWLGKTFRVVITDGRVLVGFFNCTDKDANVVLSMCAEYLEEGKDARILGNVMIPGKHIVSISVDMPKEEAEKPSAPLPTETFTDLYM